VNELVIAGEGEQRFFGVGVDRGGFCFCFLKAVLGNGGRNKQKQNECYQSTLCNGEEEEWVISTIYG